MPANPTLTRALTLVHTSPSQNSEKYHPELYLYGAHTESTVYKLLSNHSKTQNNIKSELIVVGAFDTTCKDCQVQYCSVGKWSGYDFTRVGERLRFSLMFLSMFLCSLQCLTQPSLSSQAKAFAIRP